MSLDNTLAVDCNSKAGAEIHDLSARSDVRQRLEGVLGPGAVRTAAAALSCTSGRFAYAKPQGVVIAIVEALEALQAAGAALPARWCDGAAAPPCVPLREAWAAMIGPRHLTARLASAVDRTPDAVQAAFRAPESRGAIDLAALAEILTMLREHGAALPKRWQQLPPGVTTRPRMPRERVEGAALRERLGQVLPSPSPARRLASALGTHGDAISRYMTGAPDSHGRAARVPHAIAAIVELLETLQREGVPVERWPERWRDTADN